MPLPHGDAHGGAFDFWPGLLGEVLFYLAQVLLAGAVAMTMWSGYEFFRDVRRQRDPPLRGWNVSTRQLDAVKFRHHLARHSFDRYCRKCRLRG